MAHTKSGGSTKNGRDSISKRLGVKMQDGQSVVAGQILIRQRGTQYSPGKNVLRAGDDTLYAALPGMVKFSSRIKKNFDRSSRRVTVVAVLAQ
jgi:large subunit ribosomal protein L27